MTENQAIYEINQRHDLLKLWRDLTPEQKREVLKDCAVADSHEIERIIRGVIEGQRRLF
ncbi:MAG TPA: hypothetical protein PKM58_10315 [Pyrinomonadaceae bacterium]|nr:hypothetical protein [Pyrinomonadaceae bacterium]HNU06729.1 hypothetical protein [Pyrinomonadaceae bacterium]